MEVKEWNGKKYLTWDSPDETMLDNLALGMLQQNTIYGLMPFKLLYRQQEQFFRYELTEGEFLIDWLKRMHTKTEVLDVLDSIARTSEELQAYLLEEDRLYLEYDAVLVGADGCQMAYIPLKDYHAGTVLEFVMQILDHLIYAKNSECVYIFDLKNAYVRGDIKTAADLRKWLLQLQNSSVGVIGVKQTEETDPDSETQYTSAETAPNRAVEAVHVVSQMEEDEEATVVAIPVLIRPKTNEEYRLTGESYMIGNGSGKPIDICITGNPYISGVHARIFYQNNRYWIEDKNSTNGTYVDGIRLQENAVELQKEMRVILANEEFIFDIRRPRNV